MTKQEAKQELAETLILMAEALLADEAEGVYEGTSEEGKLTLTAKTKSSQTVVSVTEWNNELEEEFWDEYIYDNTTR